jgi:hypothetical protein
MDFLGALQGGSLGLLHRQRHSVEIQVAIWSPYAKIRPMILAPPRLARAALTAGQGPA